MYKSSGMVWWGHCLPHILTAFPHFQTHTSMPININVSTFLKPHPHTPGFCPNSVCGNGQRTQNISVLWCPPWPNGWKLQIKYKLQ